MLDYNKPPTKKVPVNRRKSPAFASRHDHPHGSHRLRLLPLVNFTVCVTIFAALLLYTPNPAVTEYSNANVWNVESTHIAETISSNIREDVYPASIAVQFKNTQIDAELTYSTQPQLRQCIDSLLDHYKPDFAGIAAIDPATGRILAMSSFIRDGELLGNLALHAGFPAASLFKIVTAAALLDMDLGNPDTVYEYNGKTTTLYKANVLRHKRNKWTREVTLTSAFGKSINTVFGRLGIYHVGGENLAQYASTFGFDRKFPADFHVDDSKTEFDFSDEWSIAEAASGFTRGTTISPLHAATLVSPIVNGGVLIEPRVVEKAVHPNGPLMYLAQAEQFQVIDAESASAMKVLMRHTVRNGSARKSFSGFFKGSFSDFDAGGKTGSLTGYNPRGRTEWFAGYGDSGSRKLVVASVIVNKEKWRVKPAYLTRRIFEHYFDHPAARC